jgi:hypothetical protein
VPFTQRSIAGQIEFWAGLGKSIEPLLRGDRALSLQMAVGHESSKRGAFHVSTCE